jgi:Flp pilus assembly protein protease CpaA
MKLKVKQLVSASAWKREIICSAFSMLFLLGIGIPLFLFGVIGEPKYNAGKELAIPARAVVLLLAGTFLCGAVYAVYQAVTIFRNRRRKVEVEFVLDDVTSCEQVSDDVLNHE